jgi:hypothetical protein
MDCLARSQEMDLWSIVQIPAFFEIHILSLFLSSPLLFSCIFSVYCRMFIHIAAEVFAETQLFHEDGKGRPEVKVRFLCVWCTQV